MLQVSFHPGPRLSKLLKFGPAMSAALTTEYGALECAIEVVDSVDEAIQHINKHGSGHTDTIITNDGLYLWCDSLFLDLTLCLKGGRSRGQKCL